MGIKKHNRILFVCVCLILATLIAVVSYAIWDDIIWPESIGKTVVKKGSLSVDVSNAKDGYIYCKGASTKSRQKLRISFGGEVMTYDLNSNGDYELFPLQFGSGTYKVSLYKNTKGKKYSSEGEMKFTVTLNREDAAFLVPNQYVNYAENDRVVEKSNELCAGLTSDKEKYEAIKKWINSYFLFDYIKEITVQSGTLPDIEYAFDNQMGICQDLAAVAVAMLRVQGIPCEFVVGYLNNDYHAWTQVHLESESILYDPTMDITQTHKTRKYSVERFY